MPIWIKGVNDAAAFANKTAVELFGRASPKAPGFIWRTNLHPDDKEQFLSAYLKAFKTRKSFRAQARFRNLKGEYRWYDTLGTPRFSASGKFLGYVGASIDVTESKRIELHARFVNELDLGVEILVRTSIRLLTTRLGDYLGVAVVLWLRYRAAGMVLVREHWQGPLRGALSMAGEYRIADFISGDSRVARQKGEPTMINDVTIDPRTRQFVDNYKQLQVGAILSVPIFSEGKWEAVLNVTQPQPREWRPDEARLMHDVATRLWLAVKRARALDALRESEARARRALAEQMVAGVAECDASGKFIMVNQRYCDIAGRSRWNC
jgi:PAS domain S-box-containing protein